MDVESTHLSIPSQVLQQAHDVAAAATQLIQ